MNRHNIKSKAHYPLDEVKRLIKEGKWWVNKRNGTEKARKMGFSRPHAAIREAILALTPQDLTKSTTDYNDNKIWHDYYITVYEGQKVFMHLGIRDHGDGDKTVVFSFHEPD